MYRFRNILFCPLGESDDPAALQRVADLAAHNNATLTLFTVVPEPTRMQRILNRTGFEQEAVQAERLELADKLVGLDWTGNEAPDSKVVKATNPALSIIEQVLFAQHDLVVVTSSQDHKDQAKIRRLMRRCPCPVWVARSGGGQRQRVLAAVNPDPAEVDLNNTILELAASMTALYGGELHVTHAWELYGEHTMSQSFFMTVPQTELNAMLRTERAHRQQALDKLLTSSMVADAPWQVHLHKGNAAEIIQRVVANNAINLLVMGTVTKTAITGLISGNTAEHVLDDVKCSVVALKPPGFVTPFQPPAP